MIQKVRDDFSRHNKEYLNSRRKLMRRLARLSRTFFAEKNFAAQGFITGPGKVIKWKKRKFNVDPGRPILIKTGNMKNSIRIVSATSHKAKILSPVPYSAKHNLGLGNLPARPFMAASPELDRQCRKVIKEHVDKIFNVGLKR